MGLTLRNELVVGGWREEPVLEELQMDLFRIFSFHSLTHHHYHDVIAVQYVHRRPVGE